jgi:uncharacterized protein
MKKINCILAFLIFSSLSILAQNDTVVNATNIVLETKTGKLYGSLTVPASNKKIPVVFIIAGSGATDRNGNVDKAVNSNSYKLLADSLLKAGIASLRFDKRGVGESIKAFIPEKDLRFVNYVNDACEWVGLLKKDKRFNLIAIAGHSEGSLVGMVTAKRTNIQKFISIAGAGFPIQDVLRKQFNAQPSEEVKKMLISRLDTLVSGKVLTNVPQSLYVIFRPSVLPYLIDWFKYIPANEIAKLTIPVLILNGTTDIQIGVEEAENLHNACKQSKMVIVNGMSHLLKDAPADRAKNAATYNTTASEPIKTELVQAIIKFIKK